MARVITARRADTCQAQNCTAATRSIQAGERINYGGPGAVTHEHCAAVETSSAGRRSSSRYGRGKYAYLSSGTRVTMSSMRCEDAPCCGCKTAEAFRKLVAGHGGWIERLPDDAFKVSGTSVRTVMVVIPVGESLPGTPDDGPPEAEAGANPCGVPEAGTAGYPDWILDVSSSKREMPGQVGLVFLAAESAKPGDTGSVQLSIFAEKVTS